MKFFGVFAFIFACIFALSTVTASPTPDFFKDLEKVGQNIRDGIIKAKPAVDVVGEAATIYKGIKKD